MAKQIASNTKREPIGVGGWLFFFCLSLLVFNPLMTIVSLFYSYQEVSQLFKQFPLYHFVTIIDYTMYISIMCFGIYSGVALLKQTYDDVRIEKCYMFIVLLYPVASRIFLFMTDLPSEWKKVIFHEIFTPGFRPSKNGQTGSIFLPRMWTSSPHSCSGLGPHSLSWCIAT